MENEIIPRSEEQQVDEPISNDNQLQLLRYIDIDLRDIDSFGYMQQVFLENFSRAQYAKEYMPFWLYNRSQKFLEKRYRKKLKQLVKEYKISLKREKQQLKKQKSLLRKQKRKAFRKKIFQKITKIFKKKDKDTGS